MTTQRFLPILIACGLAFPAFSWSYIDPGSGSLILQFLLAAIFGSILFFKVLWQRIKAGISRVFSAIMPGSSNSTLSVDSDEK